MFALIFGALAWGTPPPGWELLYVKDDIEVCAKAMPGSDVIAVRGETVIDAHISVLRGILTDDTRAPEWADLMMSSVNIETVSDTERLMRETYDMPWPVTDRDFVMRELRELDPEARVATFHFASIEAPPEQGFVRGTATRTFWRLESLGDGSSTAVVLEAHASPNGRLPVFLINYIQRDWPYQNMTGLRSQTAKPDITPDPITASW